MYFLTAHPSPAHGENILGALSFPFRAIYYFNDMKSQIIYWQSWSFTTAVENQKVQTKHTSVNFNHLATLR